MRKSLLVVLASTLILLVVPLKNNSFRLAVANLMVLSV